MTNGQGNLNLRFRSPLPLLMHKRENHLHSDKANSHQMDTEYNAVYLPKI